MAKKNTRSNDNPDTSLAAPQTRKERFLAKAAGLVAQAPIGQYNRLERYLQAIIERLDAGFYPTDAQLAAINSGATEAKINAIETKLPQYGMGKNLLRNAYFVGGGSQKGYGTFPINQRDGYVVPDGVTYYSDTALTTSVGATSEYTSVTKVNATYGSIDVSGTTYYVAMSDAVPGYFASAANVWSTDGFTLQSGAGPSLVLLKPNCITLKRSSTFTNFIEPISAENYKGKTITLSALINANSASKAKARILIAKRAIGTEGGVSSDNSSEYAAGLSLVTVTKRVGTDDNAAYIQATVGLDASEAECDIYAMKLEEGDTSTLAHKENGVWVLNEVPDYGEELRRCQEWQYVSSVNASNRREQVYMYAFSNKILIGSVPFKQTMRVRPTMEKLWCYDINGNAIGITGSDVVSTQDAVLLIRDIPNSPLTPGNYYTVGVFATANPA